MNGLHLSVVGKGGAGKSVISATLARLLARAGHDVLALDSDMMPGLSLSLGADVPAEPPLNAAAEKDENGRWRLRKGIGPVRAVRGYSIEAPDGVRLLQAGKSGPEGLAPIMGAIHAFHTVIHRIRRARSLDQWAIVGDLSAGPRQTAYDWAPYADRLVLVAEPTWQSILTARRIARIARTRSAGVELLLVVNKVTAPADVRRVEGALELPAVAAVPLDEDVRAAERQGIALLDHSPSSPSVAAIERLVAHLEDGRLRGP